MATIGAAPKATWKRPWSSPSEGGRSLAGYWRTVVAGWSSRASQVSGGTDELPQGEDGDLVRR